MSQFHILGHPGFQKTYAAMKKYYYWSGLKRDSKNHVEISLLCQTNKVEQVKHPRLLQPLTVPKRKWEFISIDSIVDLPRTQKSFNSIFVIVDRLTKVARFIRTTSIVIFLKEIFVNYKSMRETICDKGKQFVSEI